MSTVHRSLCEVLQEMRMVLNTTNAISVSFTKGPLRALVEEAQILGNRMEAGLGYNSDIEKLHLLRAHLLKESE